MTRRSSTPTPTRGHAGAVGTKTPNDTHPSLTTVPTAPLDAVRRRLAEIDDWPDIQALLAIAEAAQSVDNAWVEPPHLCTPAAALRAALAMLNP